MHDEYTEERKKTFYFYNSLVSLYKMGLAVADAKSGLEESFTSENSKEI